MIPLESCWALTPTKVSIFGGRLVSFPTGEPQVLYVHDDRERHAGSEVAIQLGGAGLLVGGDGGGWAEPELLGQLAAGAPEGGPVEDWGVGERVATAEESSGLRRGLPAGAGDRLLRRS